MEENNIIWPTPTPIRAAGAKLTPFPLSALPPVLKDFAEALAVSTSTDPAMAATAILSSLSYCFSGVYRVRGKADHTEPLVLDSLIIAEPSTKKSPVISAVKRPYADFASDWNERHKTEIFHAQAEKKLMEQRISELEKSDESNADEIAELKTRLSNSEAADFRRITVDDITPESLVYQLKQNGTLLMISDEAGMLGNFAGRYSNNLPNLDLLLKSWNGESYQSDRATRESVSLRRPYMSVCLAAQPYVFDGMMSSPAFRGSGLLARFVYCFPKDLTGKRNYDSEPVPRSVSDGYKRLIYGLLEKKFALPVSETREKIIALDGVSYGLFVSFCNDYLEHELLGDLAFCADWGGKMHGLLLRIIGLLHGVKCALDGKNPEDVRVTEKTFTDAYAIALYYRDQTVHAYGLGDFDAGTLQAERIIAKIKSRGLTEIRQNDLYKLCRCKLFRNAAEFDESVNLLEEYGYVKREVAPAANDCNKSGFTLYINPKLYAQ